VRGADESGTGPTGGESRTVCLSGDLTVSYVPSPEQRDWRLLSRTQVALRESAVRVRNQIEVLLEQAQIKLSSVLSDLLGKSGRRILDALIRGTCDATELASLGDRRLHVTGEQLADALSERITQSQRIVLSLYLQQIDELERQITELDRALGLALAQAYCGGRPIVHSALVPLFLTERSAGLHTSG
jgi:transposase